MSKVCGGPSWSKTKCPGCKQTFKVYRAGSWDWEAKFCIDCKLLNIKEVKKDTRPTFEQIYMNLAKSLAERSTCSRLKVGTVITSKDFRKVLAIGYNGNASGLGNRCDSEEAGNCGCLHSEENAIINCDVPREVEKVVFVTHQPCKMCAKRLINLGNVKQVYYSKEYRDKTGIELLNKAEIYVASLE